MEKIKVRMLKAGITLEGTTAEVCEAIGHQIAQDMSPQ